MRRGRPLRRRTPLKQQSDRQSVAVAQERALVEKEGLAFRQAIRGERCVVCGRSEREAYEETGLGHQAHHVIRQEVLRRLSLDRHLWAPRAAVCVCEEPCHRRHTSRMARIRRSQLPARALEFVKELGLELELEKEYPVA